ncbi:MAG: PqqD family protein [Dehalococcoidia bacterium]|nr:PqqD family protein [Dehalococcoidia bacterium]
MSSVSEPVTAALHIQSDVVSRTVGDEMVLLDLKTGTYFTLNSVGALVWSGVEAGLSVDQIAEMVVAEFSVDVATARADIHALLSELVQQSLVTAT